MPREHFPRQSIPSSTNVVTLSLDTTTLQTSDVTSVIASTSGLVATTTTTSADPTTTSSSTETTSTPQTTPTTTSPTTTSPTTTPLQTTTTSQSPTPSPSATSAPSTSSTTPASSSVPSSTTAQSPTPSSTQQGTPTTITSSYTAFFDGSSIVTQTTYQSTIPQPSNPSSGQRTAIIAGSAAGGTALLILLLTLAFCARRKQFKRLDFIHALTLKRRQERSRATLLDLDDVDLARPPHPYTDYDSPWDARMPSTSRLSETGSVFREDVWPPPTEGTRLMDPLANLDLDLGHIVDDVMGPSSSAAHFSDRSVSSVYRGSVAEEEGVVHSRTASNASNTALLEAAGLGAAGAMPVRSSPLAQAGTKPGPKSVAHSTGGAS